MIVKILKTLLIAFAVLTIQACSVKPEVKYIDVPYEVKVPIKCVVPKAQCDFNRTTDTEVINSLVECIVDMKHNEEVCK